jgi:nucleoid-associated protein YgaU
MSGYAVFFGYNNGKNVFRLPTNPEQIEVTSNQAIETYDILKLGQIAVPTQMELKEYSFECELPIKRGKSLPGYVETKIGYDYHNPQYYINRFEYWRKKLAPFRFIAGRTKEEDADTTDVYKEAINTLVLIKEMTITEKAGEEGDKYVAFKLQEYKEFGVAVPVDSVKKKKKKATTTNKTNPKNSGHYVVKSGDCLWNIAKKFYGDGSKYTKIYNANKSIIKNPALIYPGQKLKIPS